MNQKVIACVLFALSASLAQVFANYDDGKFYVAARGGAMWLDSVQVGAKKVTLDTGYSVTGALGYEFNLPDLGNPDHPIKLQLEVESGYCSASTTQNNISYGVDMVPIMANAILNYYLTSKLYLYGGIGAGLAIETVTGGGASQDHDNYAVQARGGLGYLIAENISLEAGYRIFSEKFQSPVAQMFEAGITLRF